MDGRHAMPRKGANEAEMDLLGAGDRPARFQYEPCLEPHGPHDGGFDCLPTIARARATSFSSIAAVASALSSLSGRRETARGPRRRVGLPAGGNLAGLCS